MRLALAALLAAFACERRAPRPPPAGVRLLPEEAWLYSFPPGSRWSAEIEEEQVTVLSQTSELRLQTTQPLAVFRVRLLDEQSRSVPHQGTSSIEPTGEQTHTLRFERLLAPGAYRLVIDAPLGKTLRDASGQRYRGQRFRLQVTPSVLATEAARAGAARREASNK